MTHQSLCTILAAFSPWLHALALTIKPLMLFFNSSNQSSINCHFTALTAVSEALEVLVVDGGRYQPSHDLDWLGLDANNS